MVINGAAAIEKNRQAVNELNVFPVPDGDTGTNMSLTIGNAADGMTGRSYGSVSEAADAASSLLLRGARGNSGVILSLLFRGFAKYLKGKSEADAVDFAKALSAGVDTAYNAVMKPAEGTILTVSRVMTDAAVALAAEQEDIEELLSSVLEAGNEALALTTEQNPVLKKAGVIDAGAKGYIIIVEGMLCALRGEMEAASGKRAEEDTSAFSAFSTEEITYAFDTVFIVRRHPDKSLKLFQAYLGSIGDSIVIGEDDNSFKVHVHTNIPGEVLTEAQKYGTLELAKIENMRLQHEELKSGGKAISTDDLEEPSPVPEEEPAGEKKQYGVVAVCSGEGLQELFRDLGTDVTVTGGQTMNPSTEDILKAVESVNAETVFVFPNNKNIIMAARQCCDLTEKNVVVVPTATIPQGISALACFDPSLSVEECSEQFSSAIESVHTVLVTYAARDSEFDGQSIKAGQYLALLESSLIASESDLDILTEKVAAALAEFSPEVLTIIYGEDVTEADAEKLASRLSEAMPKAESSIVCGSQPVYYYMISAE
ncbi:MAG: DAK2 domain-containing protein [Oscillospiraceae bacterium]|nr:DAK2 domain-containing protein [Oscillospiraceae bacterium]